jgi:hypothetical protein
MKPSDSPRLSKKKKCISSQKLDRSVVTCENHSIIMFAWARKQRRKSEMDLFLQHEEEKWQESKLAIQYGQDFLKREEFERVQYVQMERLGETKKQDEKQIKLPNRHEEQRMLESKYRSELREFMEQRAEQRRLYQANKNRAQLAEFWEQRAQARRDYRASKARGEMESPVQPEEVCRSRPQARRGDSGHTKASGTS